MDINTNGQQPDFTERGNVRLTKAERAQGDKLAKTFTELDIDTLAVILRGLRRDAAYLESVAPWTIDSAELTRREMHEATLLRLYAVESAFAYARYEQRHEVCGICGPRHVEADGTCPHGKRVVQAN